MTEKITVVILFVSTGFWIASVYKPPKINKPDANGGYVLPGGGVRREDGSIQVFPIYVAPYEFKK